MKGKREEFEQSQIETSLGVFLASYNENIPAGFPRASAAMLKKFQLTHPTLFKRGDVWSVALHRKKVIDWLSSQHNLV